MISQKRITILFVLVLLAGAMIATMSISWADNPPAGAVHEPARSPEEAGRYLVRVSGCNDCHTPGFMQLGEQVPEALWLTGVPLGWRGPWGTTYASNLRLFVKPFSEDEFVKICRTRNSRPPMPWPSLHAMSDADVRSIYRYIKSLPAAGEATPEFVPPGQEPKTPYLSMMPLLPARPAATQPSASSAALR